MRYFKFIYYTTGEDFEVCEKLVDEPTFRKLQKAYLAGQDIVMEDRVIKRNLVKEMVPADEDVREYLSQGTTLKQLGLPDNPRLEERTRPALVAGTSKYNEMKQGFAEKSKVSPDIVTAAVEEGAREERKHGTR